MPTIREVLLGHVLPGAIALIGLMVIAWLARRNKKWNSTAPILLGAAFTSGYYLLHPVKTLPPQDQAGWLVYLIPIIAILAAIDSRFAVKFRLRAVYVLIVAAAFTWLLLVPFSSARPVDWISIAVVTAIIWLIWFSFDRILLLRDAREVSITFTLIALFTAAILGMSGSAIFGLQGGAFVAIAIAAAVVICITRFAFDRGLNLLFVFIWAGLLINGRFWSDVTLVHALLLISPAALVWLGQLPFIRRSGFWPAALRIAILTIPLLIAGITAGIQFQKDMQDLGY